MNALLARALPLLICVSAAAEETIAQFGTRRFIEYIPGDTPLVIAVPHGGTHKPADIPGRTTGVVGIDTNTQELGRTIAETLFSRIGHRPHLIICRLHRSKVDANRDLLEAAQGHPIAARAWEEYHQFIEQACRAAVERHGLAFLIDLHGHGHPDPRVELGYLQNSLELSDCIEALDQPSYVHASSLRWIVEHKGVPHTELLFGPTGLGAILEANGFRSTPSPRMPIPSEPFFQGGYTVHRHCQSQRNLTGLQTEANFPRLRDTAKNRARFAEALITSLDRYFALHLGMDLAGKRITPAPDAAGSQ
jgi:N-formylglutamate amidohydrolase